MTLRTLPARFAGLLAGCIVAALIRARCHREGLQWNRMRDSEVALANGVLDVNSGAFRAHRADDYLENVIPHDFDSALWPVDGVPEAFDWEGACPLWRDAMETWFGDELDKWDTLQDFWGYVLLSDARFKKALLLVGKSNTGKSQITGAMEQLVGRDFRCGLAVEHMGDPVLDGIEATQKIRELGGFAAHLPIIAVTTQAGHEIHEVYLSAGMNDLVAKPYKREHLIQIVEIWLAKNLCKT